jgi:UDP-N-acetylglucosamine 2-epimerase (non-hydrolysing)
MKWISVVGARPNFTKIAPLLRAIDLYNKQSGFDLIKHLLVHTGQHYDNTLSGSLFSCLNIPPADYNLEIGGGSHAQQVGKTMIAFESLCVDEQPDLVITVGDVNATLAGALVAKKLGLRLAHVEAGLRSKEKTEPEEINRILVDSISDVHFAPDSFAVDNLLKEGHDPSSIHMVGNIMIDTLDHELSIAMNTPLPFELPLQFIALTLHRPINVNKPERIKTIVEKIVAYADSGHPFIWPLHPRTRKVLEEIGLSDSLATHPFITISDPLNYHEMLHLNAKAQVFLTDSGGLQEECCVLGTSVVVLRNSVDRPSVLRENGGTGIMTSLENLTNSLDKASGFSRLSFRPPLWDGHTASRIVKILTDSSS